MSSGRLHQKRLCIVLYLDSPMVGASYWLCFKKDPISDTRPFVNNQNPGFPNPVSYIHRDQRLCGCSVLNGLCFDCPFDPQIWIGGGGVKSLVLVEGPPLPSNQSISPIRRRLNTGCFDCPVKACLITVKPGGQVDFPSSLS